MVWPVTSAVVLPVSTWTSLALAGMALASYLAGGAGAKVAGGGGGWGRWGVKGTGGASNGRVASVRFQHVSTEKQPAAPRKKKVRGQIRRKMTPNWSMQVNLSVFVFQGWIRFDASVSYFSGGVTRWGYLETHLSYRIMGRVRVLTFCDLFWLVDFQGRSTANNMRWCQSFSQKSH